MIPEETANRIGADGFDTARVKIPLSKQSFRQLNLFRQKFRTPGLWFCARVNLSPEGAKVYEIAGFFWWQGDRDSRSDALAGRYEKNLVHLITQLRKEFNAPHAKFVCATLGQTKKGDTDSSGKLLDALFAVDGKTGKYPEFKGNVATVYTHPLSKGGSSGGNYNGNAETYMNVGEAMGKAMVELLKTD